MSITAEYPITFSRDVSDIAARMPRRHTVVTGDGLDGVMTVASALQGCGRTLSEFAVDVRDGVAYSSVTCTMSMTPDECDEFSRHMLDISCVIAVDPY